MERSRLALVCKMIALGALLSFGGISAFAQSLTNPPPVSSPPLSDQSSELNLKKMQAEIEKLQAEVQNLRITNEALGPKTRMMSTWFGALGGVLGAVLGLTAAFLGWRWNRSFTTTQTRKLDQDRELSREMHNIELFQALGHASPRVQLAAAAVLLQKLKSAESVESRTIIEVLIAVTKERYESTPGHAPLVKFIADHLVHALDAVLPATLPKDTITVRLQQPSPLKNYDFQKSRLSNEWWERVDAREVDFFQADLSEAGLRGAFLCKAVFLEANLRQAVLRGADLRGADLRRADLRGVNLQGAAVQGAQLEGALYDTLTQWPPNFDPDTAKAVALELPAVGAWK